MSSRSDETKSAAKVRIGVTVAGLHAAVEERVSFRLLFFLLRARGFVAVGGQDEAVGGWVVPRARRARLGAVGYAIAFRITSLPVPWRESVEPRVKRTYRPLRHTRSVREALLLLLLPFDLKASTRGGRGGKRSTWARRGKVKQSRPNRRPVSGARGCLGAKAGHHNHPQAKPSRASCLAPPPCARSFAFFTGRLRAG
jgi:hypothetical protein